MLFNTVFTAETTNSQCLVFTLGAAEIAEIAYYHPLGKDVSTRLQLVQSTKLQQIFVAGPLASIQFKFEAEIPIRSAEKCQISTPLLSGPV